MSINTDRLRYLMEQFENNQISENEFRELFVLIKETDNEKAVKNILIEGLEQQQSEPPDEKKLDGMLQKILRQADDGIRMMPERKGIKWWRIAVAVVFILVAGGGGYFWWNHQPQKDIAALNEKPVQIFNDVAPGKNKAILTLADGTRVILDSVANGLLAQQGNIKVMKPEDGELVYKGSSANDAINVFYNTISTPRGGQYQVTLPDGTKVWLNAASSLRYPTAFINERNVELTGEGYFEVAKNTAMPFHVKVNDMQVKVLGTHFNVMAYDDESAVKTTLLEGAVSIRKESKTVLLSPGQQAQLDRKGEISFVKDADVELAVAWKNGYTSFKSADIKSIMRQMERWYDVEVVYEGDIPERYFTGEVPRNANLSQLLKILKMSDIDFSLEGKTITVRP